MSIWLFLSAPLLQLDFVPANLTCIVVTRFYVNETFFATESPENAQGHVLHIKILTRFWGFQGKSSVSGLVLFVYWVRLLEFMRQRGSGEFLILSYVFNISNVGYGYLTTDCFWVKFVIVKEPFSSGRITISRGLPLVLRLDQHWCKNSPEMIFFCLRTLWNGFRKFKSARSTRLSLSHSSI